MHVGDYQTDLIRIILIICRNISIYGRFVQLKVHAGTQTGKGIII